jgi:hypothetical protein
MSTTLHIPESLLRAIDERAAERKLSRESYIVQALEDLVRTAGGWTPGLFERLSTTPPEDAEAVDEMTEFILQARSSRRSSPL